MEITFIVTQTEKYRLMNYASQHKSSGHWGSSDLLIPEEQTLYSIIKNADKKIEVSLFYAKMLIQWISESTSGGTALLPEDVEIIKKMYRSLRDYYESLFNKYQVELEQIDDVLVMINDISAEFPLPKKNSLNNKEHCSQTQEKPKQILESAYVSPEQKLNKDDLVNRQAAMHDHKKPKRLNVFRKIFRDIKSYLSKEPKNISSKSEFERLEIERINIKENLKNAKKVEKGLKGRGGHRLQ